MPAEEQAEAAPAKVNLYLRVTGRRSDGKHELDSLVVFADVADRVALLGEDRGGPRLAIEGPFAAGLSAGEDNLVLRAADFAAARGAKAARARFRLTKNLPHAAGIGGGSADAAATLRLLGRAFGIAGIGAGAETLGADVPVCLGSRSARMRGIGEELAEAPLLPPLGLCLVHPGIALATARIFAAYPERNSEPAALPAGWADAEALAADLGRLQNDLEATAIALCPVIAEALAAIATAPGALLARMSGSGATCYGLFRDEGAACEAARRLGRPGWWTWGGGLAMAPATNNAALYAAPFPAL